MRTAEAIVEALLEDGPKDWLMDEVPPTEVERDIRAFAEWSGAPPEVISYIIAITSQLRGVTEPLFSYWPVDYLSRGAGPAVELDLGYPLTGTSLEKLHEIPRPPQVVDVENEDNLVYITFDKELADDAWEDGSSGYDI